MKQKLILISLSITIAVLLSACGDAGCKTECSAASVNINEQIGDKYALVKYAQPCNTSCPTLSDVDGGSNWNGRFYLVRADSFWIQRIDSVVDKWYKLKGDAYGVNLGEKRFLVQWSESSKSYQSYVFDPKHNPMVYALGGAWGEGVLNSTNTMMPIIPNYWRGDTILLNLSRGVSNKFYLQNTSDGKVSELKVKGFENVLWNDVMFRNDTLYTLLQKNLDSSYLYSILENKGVVDSLLLKTDSLTLLNWAWSSHKNSVAFARETVSENMLYLKNSGVLYGVMPLKILAINLYEFDYKASMSLNVIKSGLNLSFTDFKDSIIYSESSWK